MAQVDKLETWLDDVLNKNAPFKLPAKSRKTLAGAMWWLALIGGVLQLWLAWGFWQTAHLVDRLVDYTNALSSIYGDNSVVHHLGMFYYTSLVVLLISAVLLLLAAPHLKAMRKQGWDLVFYGLLITAVYGVVQMFADYGSFSHLLGTLIGSAISAFFLFQVREYFLKSAAAKHKA